MELWSKLTGADHFCLRYPGRVTFTMRVPWKRAKELHGKYGGWIFYDPKGLLDCDINLCYMKTCPCCSKLW